MARQSPPTGSYDTTYYEGLLEGLYRLLGDYHRLGGVAYKPGLERMQRLCAWLGHPERAFRVVHVAGTNGKGSVCHTIASVLSAAGYRVGLYTSPHLIDYRERIRVNGQMIPALAVIDFIERWQREPALDDLSFFELTTGLAFEHFALERVEIAVIEVGMGGKLDSTNVVDPAVSVITSIGWDHQQFLGNTLDQIARQKAGIIKPGRPVVVWGQVPGLTDVFTTIAGDKAAPLVWADERWVVTPDADPLCGRWTLSSASEDTSVGWAGRYAVSLGGAYQRANLTTALAALEQLESQSVKIPTESLAKGLAEIPERTGLQGRWQKIGEAPLTILDGAHNAQGLHAVFDHAIALAGEKPLALVLGSLSDRPLEEWVGMIPLSAYVYPCAPDTPRARPVETLIEGLVRLRPEVQLMEAPRELTKILSLAREAVGPMGVVLVTGSLYLVSDALKALGNRKP